MTQLLPSCDNICVEEIANSRVEEITTEHINDLLQNYFDRLFPLLEKKFKGEIPSVQVRLNSRMRSVLGRAYIEDRRIELNERLLKKHPEELAPTLAHELAHVIAPVLYGRNGYFHRLGWKKIMTALGFEPTRTHSLDVDELKRPQRILSWATCGCPGRKHPIRARVYRNMKRHRHYACLKCKQTLKLCAESSLLFGAIE